jgi:hypothetical protein
MTKLRALLGAAAVLAVVAPLVHLVFTPSRAERQALAARIAERQANELSGAEDPERLRRLRGANPEWDFMRRTFTVLALANRALAEPGERDRNLAVVDRITADTIATEREAGQQHFLLPYGRAQPFLDPEARSVFVDGEIVLMIAARELVEPRSTSELRDEAHARARRIERAMRRSPTLSAESYPDECWTFCNTTALAALRLLDRVDGSAAHAPLAREWISYARAHLVEPTTGLLVSSFTRDGRVKDGPEGSSIWMSAHNLLVVDTALACDQYARARRELGAEHLGFGWAREWPDSARENATADVDSGPIIPLLRASPSSSGFGLLAASAFDDEPWRDALLASLGLVGYREGGEDHGYVESNEVGDAVLGYALAFGPLWATAKPACAGPAPPPPHR